MAGHSKWANIRYRKSAQDARRGKIFTRLIRAITIAARQGAAPEDNPLLRSAVTKALAANMTRDTIDRAVAKGSGTAGGDQLEEIVYEGYGPGGVALLIETATDNRNRTVSEVRHALTRNGGNMGASGSVNYLFQRVGEIRLNGNAYSEEQIMELVLDAGADDLSEDEANQLIVRTSYEAFSKVCAMLEAASITPEAAEIQMLASTEVELGEDQAHTLLKLLDMLEDLDDTQNVYHNASINDEVLQRLNA